MSGRAIAGLLLAVTVAAPGAARAQSPAGPRALNAALEGVAAEPPNNRAWPAGVPRDNGAYHGKAPGTSISAAEEH